MSDPESTHEGTQDRSSDNTASPAPVRRRRWRRLRLALVAIVILALVAVFALTRPAVLRSILQPTLSTALGGAVTMEDVRLEGFSTLLVRSLTLRAHDWRGPSGEIARATDVKVKISLWEAIFGEFEVETLDIGEIDLRIAEVEATPGRFNLNALTPPTTTGGSTLQLGTVVIRRADVTIGLAEADGDFVPSATRSYTAFLRPDPNAPAGVPKRSLYVCGVDEASGAELLRGTVDARTGAVALTIGRLALTRDTLDFTPLAIRQTALATGLSGVVSGGTIEWSRTNPLSATVRVEDVDLEPRGLNLGDRWVRFQDGVVKPSMGSPKLRVTQGSISFRQDEIVLDQLHGVLASSADVPDLVPLPVQVSATFGLGAEALRNVNWSDASARDAWVDAFLTLTPFKVSIAIHDFDSDDAEGKPRGIELPAQVAGALQTFGVDRWNLELDAEFSRAAPTVDASGARRAAPIRSRGQALLKRGSGAFDEFPYPLHDVQAHITFDQTDDGVDRVSLEYLSGRSPTETSVTLRGTVLHPGPEAEVALTLTAPDTPIDATLFACFQGDARRSLEELFSVAAAKALQKAGLLGNTDIKALETEEATIQARLASTEVSTASTPPSSPATTERARLERELARIRRTKQAHPFELGGRLDLNLTIARAHGRAQPTIVEGTLDVRRAGVLVSEFPYPLTVTKGTVVLSRTGIEFRDDGLHAVTLDGGAVRVTGKIGMDQTETDARVRPRIVVIGVDDEISPLLLAAIPPDADESRDGWPGARLSATSALLSAAGLGGILDYRIEVRGANRTPSLDLALSRGTIDVGEAGRAYQLPVGFSIDDVSGRVRLDGRMLKIEDFSGTTDEGGGTATLSGTIGTRSTKTEGPSYERDLTLKFVDTAIDSWLVEMLPDLERTQAADFWRRFRPRGTFDATLRFQRDAAGVSHVTGDIAPRSISTVIDGVDVAVARVDGAFIVDVTNGIGKARLQDLAFAIQPEAAVPGGVLRVAGTLCFGPDPQGAPPLELAIALEGGRFESSIVAASARVAGGSALADGLRTVNPVGRFEAEARVVRDPEGVWTWHTTLTPRTLQATLGSARPTLAFDGAGAVRVNPSTVAFDRLRATIDGGTVGFNGSLDLSATRNVLNGTLSLSANRITDSVQAFLPEPIKSGQRELNFAADELDLPDARLRVEWQPSRGLTNPDVYRLDTSLVTRGGSFSAGLPLEGIDGSLELAFALDARAGAPTYSLRATMEASTLRVYERDMRNGRATLELAPDGRTIIVPQFEGTIAGGRIAGDARLDTESNQFAVDIRLSDAKLGPLLDPNPTDSRRGTASTPGTVDARLSMQGNTDDVRSRTGRGRIAVRDATIASTALTLRLVELSQLALPLNSAIRSVDITYFIDGPLARFEQFRLAASNVDIDGTGFVDTRDFTIDATFRSRGRIAIMSDIIGAVTDTLFEIHVTGPITNPRGSLRPLPVLTRPR